MAPVTQVFLFISYAVIAAAIGLLPPRMVGADPLIWAGAGTVFFMVTVLVTFWWLSRRHQMVANYKLEKMHNAAAVMRHDLERIRRDMEVMHEGQSSSDVLSELKVLQTLLNRVVDSNVPISSADKTPGTGLDARVGAEMRQSDDMSSHVGKPMDLDVSGLKVQDDGASFENIQAGQLLEIIRSSLSENRVDLYLQPIVGLPTRRKTHYECFSRVRDGDGNIIVPSQYLSLAESGGLVGTLDNLLLFRLIQLVRRLGPRRPDIRFFCNLSAYSLHDNEFFPQFIEFMSSNREFAQRMVFEIAQDDMEQLDDDVKALLHELGRQGFAFSLDRVTNTNIDIEAMENDYFKWIKVEHSHLRETFDVDGIEDYYRTLKRHGINLIASHVEGELDVVRMTDAKLEYSQGFLFGAPRSVHELTGEL